MQDGPQLGLGSTKGVLAPVSSGDLQALAVTQLFARGFETPTVILPPAQVNPQPKLWSDPAPPSPLQPKSHLLTDDDDWDFLTDLWLDDDSWRSSVVEAFAA